MSVTVPSAPRAKSVVLQEEVTLEDALLGGMSTFPNGCNFRVLFDERGQPWLEYGCYGVLVNLTQGKERLLHHWLKGVLEEPAMKLKVMLKMIKASSSVTS